MTGFDDVLAPDETDRPLAEPEARTRRELRDRERATGSVPLPRDKPARRSRGRSVPTKTDRATKRVRPTLRTLGSRLLSVGAMVFAGALAVGMSVPANALGPVGGGAAGDAGVASITSGQSVVVGGDTLAPSVQHNDYGVSSWADQLAAKYASVDYSYRVGTGNIRWPFPVEVPLGSPYGPRIAPCGSCSTFHNGTDFLPGEGAPIYSIAAGTVSLVADDGEYGQYVTIDHVVKGQKVQSLYAHMQRGSVPLVQGQTIAVGEFIGLVGRTGQATGPHLHLEIIVEGARVDPFAWLKANAG
ncbi:MAG TPA: M23 family metallopeptidase [Pseudolysinimonas sp.]|nr:M23 family metallopeptidase [Pseudolysinimonas sp.]